MSGKLQLGVDPASGKQRYYLDGAPVDDGDEIEIGLAGGVWVAGRFQWSGIEARWPGIRFELAGPWETEEGAKRPAAVMALPPEHTSVRLRMVAAGSPTVVPVAQKR